MCRSIEWQVFRLLGLTLFCYALGLFTHLFLLTSVRLAAQFLEPVEALYGGKGNLDGLRFARAVGLSPDGAYVYVAAQFVASLPDSALWALKVETIPPAVTVESHADQSNPTNRLPARFDTTFHTLQVVRAMTVNDRTGATVDINQRSGQSDPSNLFPAVLDAEFSEAVADFEASDVQAGGTAAGLENSAIEADPEFQGLLVI